MRKNRRLLLFALRETIREKKSAQGAKQAGKKAIGAGMKGGQKAAGVDAPALALDGDHLSKQMLGAGGGVARAAGIAARDEPKPACRSRPRRSRRLRIDSDQAVSGQLLAAAEERDVADRQGRGRNRLDDHGLVLPDRGVHAAAGGAEAHGAALL